jgi:predicted acylesterase/phospholipase RssA
MADNTNTPIALVLQGGGALGAFEAGAIEYLYEQGMRPVIVSGVSMGAITAVTLAGARGDPAETLKALWDKLTLPDLPFMSAWAKRHRALFGSPNFFRIRWDYYDLANWTNFYDISPLRRTLEELIDFDRVNDPTRMRVIVTAVNVETGAIERFSNGDPARPLTVDHVLASGSLPPGLPMTPVGGRWYWDGGLFDNTPLVPVIDSLDPQEAETLPIYVLALFPTAGRRPDNMIEVFDRILEIALQNKVLSDYRTAKRINDFVRMLRTLNEQLPRDARVREDPMFTQLMQYKCLEHLKLITRPEAALDGGFDFSRATLGEHIRGGYNAAREFCERDRAGQ